MKKITIIPALFLMACSSGNKSEKPVETKTETGTVVLNESQIKNAGISAAVPESRTFSGVLAMNGVIDVPPQNMVSVSAPLGGYLRSTRLLPGMPVSKGETIALMDDPQYIQLQQDYLSGQVKLGLYKAEYDRQQELHRSNAGSDKTLQQAESDYLSLKIAQKGLAEKLFLIGVNPASLTESNMSRTVAIHSPISGFVSRVNVNIGKYVNPSDVMFELVNPNDIHLNLKVYEKDLDKVFTGQKVLAWTNANPDKKYPCEVILIGRDIGEEKTVEMHCHFEQYDKILLPGMFMNAEVQLQQLKGFGIKDEAILSSGNKNYCFVQQSHGHYELREITTGLRQDGYTMIRFTGSEIKGTEQVVQTGAHSLWMVLKNTGDE